MILETYMISYAILHCILCVNFEEVRRLIQEASNQKLLTDVEVIRKNIDIAREKEEDSDE